MVKKLSHFYKTVVNSHQTIFIIMLQQLLSSTKLEAVINFYICLVEQNILQTLLSAHNQGIQ